MADLVATTKLRSQLLATAKTVREHPGRDAVARDLQRVHALGRSSAALRDPAREDLLDLRGAVACLRLQVDREDRASVVGLVVQLRQRGDRTIERPDLRHSLGRLLPNAERS